MRMKRSQLGAVIFFLALFAVLYFACETKSPDQKALEKSRAMKMEIINIERIKSEAVSELEGPAKIRVLELGEKLKANENKDSLYVEDLKSMASIWYAAGNPLISAHYADQIAQIENNAGAWQIAGTSYLLAAQRLDDEKEKQYAIQKSRTALENALSFDPENIENRINLALSFVEMPVEDNPMKGILMLVELNKQHPDNIPVLIQLGRLALGTNQLDKAVERMSKVLELDPQNTQAHCYLAEIYSKQGEMEKAEKERVLCDLN